MVKVEERIDDMPVVRDYKDFDKGSGIWLERLIFNNRIMIVCLCLLLTVVLAWQASRIVINASFERMIPQSHPYIKNYLANKNTLRGGSANSIRVIVENTKGDIFDQAYLEALRKINDDIFLTSGVDRAWVKSLWMPAVRWQEVTEIGFMGGPVMPDNYDGSQGSIDQLKQNIARSGIVGMIVANNFKSSMIIVPLLETESGSEKRLDYRAFSQRLENIRQKYEGDGTKATNIKIHIIGFAKIVGDLIEGLMRIIMYFIVAIFIVMVIVYCNTHCIRSSILLVCCSIIAVTWQVGIVSTLGYELDPYSILVPFLIFAIGVSHGAQKMNGIMQDVGRGSHTLVAARYTFRRLFVPGITALLADAVGFAVLMLIDIPVIKQLALTASIGVAILIFTNLILLPILLSFVGVSPVAAQRSLKMEEAESKGEKAGAVWRLLMHCTERRVAIPLVSCAILLAVFGYFVSLNLKIGDLDPGAPELRPDSRYNKDNAFATKNYALSSDEFTVIVRTPRDGVIKYQTLIEADRLG